MEHKELGVDVVKRAVGDLNHIGVGDGQPKMAGRNITLLMNPLPESKRILKYNEPDEE